MPAAPELGATSSAQPVEGPPGYQQAVDLAVDEFGHGNYLEARARFAEAHRLWPNARSLRALGYCDYELKSYVSSRELLQAALASTVRPLSESQRKETEELLQRANGYVGRYVIQTVPADAQLTLDGIDAALDGQRAIFLRVGEHTLEASALGHRTVRRVLQAEGGADRTLLIELPVLPVASTNLRQDDEPLRRKWWLWTGVGAVVVAGVAAGLVAALHDPGTAKASGGNSGQTYTVLGVQ